MSLSENRLINGNIHRPVQILSLDHSAFLRGSGATEQTVLELKLTAPKLGETALGKLKD